MTAVEVQRVNVTLSAYEGDNWPRADDEYEAFVTARLREMFPGAEIAVSTSANRTRAFVYPMGKLPDNDQDLSRDVTEFCAVTWWDDFCAESAS